MDGRENVGDANRRENIAPGEWLTQKIRRPQQDLRDAHNASNEDN